MAGSHSVSQERRPRCKVGATGWIRIELLDVEEMPQWPSVNTGLYWNSEGPRV
jgi:hypothetical protein